MTNDQIIKGISNGVMDFLSQTWNRETSSFCMEPSRLANAIESGVKAGVLEYLRETRGEGLKGK